MMDHKTVVLEQSTNTHALSGKFEVVKNFANGDVAVESEKATVVHGEHGAFELNGKFLKTNQVEFNPVTRTLQNAHD